MQYQNVGELFAGLEKAGEKMKQTVSNLTDEQANLRENGAGWSIAEIVEHVGMVTGGVVLMTKKMLGEAEKEGIKFDGNFNPPLAFSEEVVAKQQEKLQAPERVHPQGTQSIAESLKKLDESLQSLNELRPRLEASDASNKKFPHPYFGEMNSYEWLAVAGLHELRHVRQIKRILAG